MVNQSSRFVYCPFLGCKQKIIFKDINEHLGTIHQGKVSNAYQKDGEKDKFFIKPHWTRSTDEKSWWLSQMKTNDGMVFFLMGKIERRILHFWVYFVGLPQDVRNYLCTISVANPQKNEKHLCKNEVRLLDEKHEDIIFNQSTFMIGIESAKRCLDDESRLKVEVEIHRLDENENKDIDDLKVEDIAADMSVLNLSKALVE